MKNIKFVKKNKCFYCDVLSFGKYHIECYRTFPSMTIDPKKESLESIEKDFQERKTLHKRRMKTFRRQQTLKTNSIRKELELLVLDVPKTNQKLYSTLESIK